MPISSKPHCFQVHLAPTVLHQHSIMVPGQQKGGRCGLTALLWWGACSPSRSCTTLLSECTSQDLFIWSKRLRHEGLGPELWLRQVSGSMLIRLCGPFFMPPVLNVPPRSRAFFFTSVQIRPLTWSLAPPPARSPPQCCHLEQDHFKCPLTPSSSFRRRSSSAPRAGYAPHVAAPRDSGVWGSYGWGYVQNG